MSSPNIDSFLFDEENEDKIASHGLSVRDVMQILDHIHIVQPNKRGRRGLYLIIGRNKAGRCISVPIEKTRIKTTWRPITAWLSNKGDETMLQKKEQYEKGL